MNPSFGAPASGMRTSQPRPVAVRQMLVNACKELQALGSNANGYVDLLAIKGRVNSINPPGHDTVSEEELLDMCETVGSSHNGGGSFDVRIGDDGKLSVRFEADRGSVSGRNVLGAPGEIGSPIVGVSSPSRAAPPT